MKIVLTLFILQISSFCFGSNGGGGMKTVEGGDTVLVIDGQIIWAHPFESQLENQLFVPVNKFQFYGSTDYSKMFRVNGTEQTFEILDSAISESPTLPIYVNEAIKSGDWISFK